MAETSSAPLLCRFRGTLATSRASSRPEHHRGLADPAVSATTDTGDGGAIEYHWNDQTVAMQTRRIAAAPTFSVNGTEFAKRLLAGMVPGALK